LPLPLLDAAVEPADLAVEPADLAVEPADLARDAVFRVAALRPLLEADFLERPEELLERLCLAPLWLEPFELDALPRVVPLDAAARPRLDPLDDVREDARREVPR
jgi:hypothetical protein